MTNYHSSFALLCCPDNRFEPYLERGVRASGTVEQRKQLLSAYRGQHPSDERLTIHHQNFDPTDGAVSNLVPARLGEEVFWHRQATGLIRALARAGLFVLNQKTRKYEIVGALSDLLQASLQNTKYLCRPEEVSLDPKTNFLTRIANPKKNCKGAANHRKPNGVRGSRPNGHRSDAKPTQLNGHRPDAKPAQLNGHRLDAKPAQSKRV